MSLTRGRNSPPTLPLDFAAIEPFSKVDAERAVVASAVLLSDCIDEVSAIINADDFRSEACGALWRVLLRMHDAHTPIDHTTLANELEHSADLERIGGLPEILAIIETVPHAAHAKHYAEMVRDASIRRQSQQAGIDLFRESGDATADIDDALSQAADAIERQMSRRIGDTGSRDMRTILESVAASVYRGRIEGLRTGFTGLDNRTNGLQPGDLVIVAARPSMGKTAFVGNIALNVARRGDPVMFFSLEQTGNELAERMLSSIGEIDSRRLRARKLTADDSERFELALSQLAALPIAIEDRSTVTVRQIAAVARIGKRRDNVRLIIIDYLQLICPEDGKAPREQQIETISRRLKCLARDLQVPVICLSQLNRSLESRDDKRPRLSDLRSSGAIEQDADVCLFLHRPTVYDLQADPCEAQLICAKFRNGQTGCDALRWNGATMTFADTGPSSDEYERYTDGGF